MSPSSKGHTMLEEIREQPDALARLLDAEWAHVLDITGSWQDALPRPIFIAARGTSDHAALYAKYLFETMNGIMTGLAAPSIASVYHADVNVTGALLIGISQSGEAADVIAVLEQANRDGAETLAITNVADSPLARTATHTILLNAGPEKAVAATKTFTTTMAALLMLSAAMSGKQELIDDLHRLPSYVASVLKDEEEIRDKVLRFRYLEECVVLGRGYNLSTAHELALKLRETSYIRAQPFASPDFVHGPIAILEKGYPVIAFANSGATLPTVMEVIQQTRSRGAEAVVIGNAPDALDMADVAFPVCLGREVPEVVSPFPSIVAGQIFAQALSVMKGIDPDQPRGLSKVTITV